MTLLKLRYWGRQSVSKRVQSMIAAERSRILEVTRGGGGEGERVRRSGRMEIPDIQCSA
jgi:hypothetical protein